MTTTYEVCEAYARIGDTITLPEGARDVRLSLAPASSDAFRVVYLAPVDETKAAPEVGVA